jgi:ATP-dependent exoDNAse (exonuclease V) beta subunit
MRFTESDHSYVDSQNTRYISGTTLVKSAFLPFDAAAVAAKCAAAKGKTPEALQAEWKASGEASREMGTRFHENMVATILGKPRPNPPMNDREMNMTKAGVEACKKLMARFGKSLSTEMIVFSPFMRVAGSIDLLANEGNNYFLFDFKTNEKIARENQWQSSSVWAIRDLQDCDFNRYSLQLSTYERVLRREAYIPETAKMKRMLIWMGADGCHPEFIETPDMQREVAEIMLERQLETANGLTLP